MTQLNTGDAFPVLEGDSVAHGRVKLPEDISTGQFAVILAYRAHW